jgi:hypothetical protein
MPDPTDESRLWVPKVHELRKETVEAVIKHLGPIHVGLGHPRLEDNPAIVLRDSMLYRAESVGYHVDLLKWQFATFTQQSQLIVGSGAKPHLIGFRKVLTFLSDDILFNSISMLDYVGNLVSCTLSGPNDQRLKWNGVVKAARDRTNPLAAKAAARMMLTLHKEWIDRLHGARSEIIHERITLGDGGRTITFPGGTHLPSTLSFEMPPTVVKRLAFLSTFANTKGRVQLVVGAEQIALRAIDAAKAIMTALLEDLGG